MTARPLRRVVGRRERYVIPRPADHLWRLHAEGTPQPTSSGFVEWALEASANPMSRELAGVLGVRWERARLDNVLAALDLAWFVARESTLAQLTADEIVILGWERDDAVQCPTLDPRLETRLHRHHDSDWMLYELTPYYEDAAMDRLRSATRATTTGGDC